MTRPSRRPSRGASLALGALVLGMVVACSATEERQTGPSPSPTAAPSVTATVSTVQVFPPPGTHQLPRALRQRLDRALRRSIDGGILGATAAVVTDTGRWAGAAGRGLRGEALVPDASLMYASITKTFTAAEVVVLADRGLVNLDEPISTYLDLPTRDNGATIRELLNMRSGLRDFGDGPQVDKALRRPDRHWSPEETLLDVPPEVDEAGAIFSYSNTNYILLGQLIEKVTGMSYARALRADLLDPAGLDGVAVQDAERPHPPLVLADPDLVGSDRYLPTRALASWAWSAGGIAGDVTSAATWGYLLYGGRIIDPELVATMHPLDDGLGYGFGTEGGATVRPPSFTFVGHTGDFGPYRSKLIVATERPLAIAVLLTHEQTGQADPLTVVEGIADAYNGGPGHQ